MHSIKRLVAAWCVAAISLAGAAQAQDKPTQIDFGDGTLRLVAPETWQRKQPQSPIVEHEFAIAPAEGDDHPGRMTLMAAGGGAQANIERWYGQFTQPDGGNTSDRAKVKKLQVAGDAVQVVDISGTYRDQRGPNAPAVERSKYRMLAAIIPSKAAGTYYLKFYGPERTVAAQEPAFMKMIEGLERK